MNQKKLNKSATAAKALPLAKKKTYVMHGARGEHSITFSCFLHNRS
jgi:hypothetical protein